MVDETEKPPEQLANEARERALAAAQLTVMLEPPHAYSEGQEVTLADGTAGKVVAVVPLDGGGYGYDVTRSAVTRFAESELTAKA